MQIVRVQRFFLSLVSAVCMALLAGPRALAESGGAAAIDNVDKQLFVELVKLARFNAHFQLEANRHQPWRFWAYPMLREAGTGCNFAATLIDLRQQVRGLDNPRKISRNDLKNAIRCGITGNAISGGASAAELAQNAWIMMRAARNGYSPGASLRFVKDVMANTDRLLDEREKLVNLEQSAEHRKTLQTETLLVRRIRQQLVYEFATWSAHSRDRAWRENVFYAIDAGQSFTRMSAGILAMQAFRTPKTARASALCGLVGNSLATLNPIIRNIAGIAIRKHQQHVLARVLPTQAPEELSEGMQPQTSSPWLQKVALLTNRTNKIDIALERENAQIQRYRQIAQQQSISGPLIGLTGVASSTLATEAVFGYSDDIKTATRLGLSGRITQGVGQAYSLLNTPITLLIGIKHDSELRRKGELPSQILERRLQQLDSANAR